MAQKQLLWVEVGAHAVRSQQAKARWGNVGRRGCHVSLGCLCCVLEASWVIWYRQISLCGAPPQGVVCKVPPISEWVV
jgi:hypothetical protein